MKAGLPHNNEHRWLAPSVKSQVNEEPGLLFYSMTDIFKPPRDISMNLLAAIGQDLLSKVHMFFRGTEHSMGSLVEHRI